MLLLGIPVVLAYADSLRGNDDNQNTVAVIVTLDGKIVTGVNREGVYNKDVQDVLDFNGKPNRFNRQCAEVNAVSKALNQGYDLTCAVIVVVKVGGINSLEHGFTKPPCDVCKRLLSYYAVIYRPI